MAFGTDDPEILRVIHLNLDSSTSTLSSPSSIQFNFEQIFTLTTTCFNYIVNGFLFLLSQLLDISELKNYFNLIIFYILIILFILITRKIIKKIILNNYSKFVKKTLEQ